MREPEKDRATEQPERREKKPYQKPAFEYEQVFETMALTCSKSKSVDPNCKTGNKIS